MIGQAALVTIDIFSIAAGEREVIGALSHILDEDFTAAIRLLERGALRADRVVAAGVALEETVTIGFASVDQTDLSGVKVRVSPRLRPGAAA